MTDLLKFRLMFCHTDLLSHFIKSAQKTDVLCASSEKCVLNRLWRT